MFFVAFLLVNLYLFMRVFLAVVYKSYKDNLKAEVREAVQLKRDLLQRSYQLLVNDVSGGDGGGDRRGERGDRPIGERDLVAHDLHVRLDPKGALAA